MIPNFDFLGRTVSVYQLAALAGVLTIIYFGYRTADRRGMDPIAVLNMILLSFIGMYLGGKLLYALTNLSYLRQGFAHASSFAEVLTVMVYGFGGMVFYGGLIGAMSVYGLCVRKKRLSVDYIDLGTLLVPLFHTFGRIGCFFGGCCYGVVCKFGFTYRHSLIPDANGVPRFPVQLFEAGYNLMLFFVLWHFFQKRRYSSWLLNIYLCAYPIFRFVIEFFRGDAHRGIYAGMSTSQWISLLILLVNSIVILCRKKKNSATNRSVAA